MAITTYANAQVIVNSVDLSDHVDQVSIDDSRTKVDITTMGSTNNVYAKGLGDAKITVTFLNDYAAGKVYATLQPLIGSASSIQVEVRPVNAARSATNPAFVLANAMLFDFPAFDAQGVGQASKAQVVFENSATTGMSYLTS